MEKVSDIGKTKSTYTYYSINEKCLFIIKEGK